MVDFEKADRDSNAVVRADAEYLPEQMPTNMLEQREFLVKQYHKGSESLAKRLHSEGKNNIETMVMALVDEVIKETDNLLGNGLIAIEQGELRDASVISAKRAEVLEKAIKAVQTKQMFDKESGIDVDSPSMRVVFRFFMKKSKQVFDKLGFGEEISDSFFKTLSSAMENWQDELKRELDSLNSLSPE